MKKEAFLTRRVAQKEERPKGVEKKGEFKPRGRECNHFSSLLVGHENPIWFYMFNLMVCFTMRKRDMHNNDDGSA